MQTKLCTKCGEQKPRDSFHKRTKAKDKLHPYCKICNMTCARKFHTENPEKYKHKQKEYQETFKNKNPNKLFDIQKRYRDANQDKRNARTAKRRAAKLQRTPHWLTKNQLDEIETFYTAALAFRLYTGQEYHVDHIVPLQGKNVSGLHVPWNLRVISAIDNLKKSNLFED